MKQVALITGTRFWRKGAGVWTRTLALVRYLSRHTELVVVFIDYVDPRVVRYLQSVDAQFRFVPLTVAGKLKQPEIANRIRTLCADVGPFDTYIIDKLMNSFALQALPPGGQRLVDTHDLLSQKTQSMGRYGYRPRFPLSEQRERELLRNYDGVICIQSEDYAIVSDWFGPAKAILAQHPATINPQRIRDEVRSIGFIASTWLPNVEGLKWFLHSVWPAFSERGVNFDIHGPIKRSFGNHRSPRVHFHGYAESLAPVYAEIDILINPVRFGSGLKIKTIEALGNGLPLVTTREGARGLTALDGRALLLADDGPSFIRALNDFLNDAALRRRIGRGGLEYAREKLSPEACFGDLVDRINAS